MREIQEAKHMDRSFESKANKDYEEIRLNVSWCLNEFSFFKRIIFIEIIQNNECIFAQSTNEELEAAIKAIPEPSFALCLSRIFVFKFIGIIAIKIVHDLLNFARPIILE